jgi:hypothetical protein
MITKINKSIKWVMAVANFSLLTITSSLLFSCADDDSNGSAHVGLGIKVFFPTKVVTNQPVTINGSGFTGATEIEFPGGTKVTDFEIVSDDMIKVSTPSGIPSEGGKIVVRTANAEAESRLPLTIGHTRVSGFSKQPGESASGGELITVFGSDLEFINSVELLDADGVPQLIDHKDFYRKGTNNLIFRVPQKNIYKGNFAGVLHTYDGQNILMPELAYEPAADNGHWETVKTSIWKNGGTLGEINWSSDYRFAPESNSTGEECYTVPQDVWEKMKKEQFFVTIKGTNPQIRVTSGWWSTTWTGDDIFPGNERLEDNGDGTFTLTVDLAGDALLDVIDEQHLLFTGSGYSVEEIYFAEEVWVDGPGEQEVKVPIWENDGTLGEINWSSDYRFAPESNSTGEECYTVPLDVWERMKSETFYVTVKGTNPQIRVTSGWWSTTWTGDDIFPGNERLEDNGDGTFTLTVNLAGDALLDVLDAQHLLFTGSGYSVEDIYFIDIVSGEDSKEVVFWTNDGSLGEINWGSDYRFSSESMTTGEECYAIPQAVWDSVIMNGTFYLTAKGSDWVQMRITTGWWTTTWTGDDITTGSDRINDHGDGTFTIEINFSGDPILDYLDAQHLLFTGSGYTPMKLYYTE